MDPLNVHLDGIPTEIRRLRIDLKQLILDIENPRIQYFLDTRLNDNVTQEKIKFALAEGNDQYEKLKEHIERNGGIYDPIWVMPKEKFFSFSLLLKVIREPSYMRNFPKSTRM